LSLPHPAPDIYTLSLHDALPICPAPSCVTTPDYTRTRVHYRKRYTRRVSFNAELQPCFGGGMVFCEGGTTKCGSAKSRPFDLLADRKSTRLNSSHRTISYAVFCL